VLCAVCVLDVGGVSFCRDGGYLIPVGPQNGHGGQRGLKEDQRGQ
jgi:hypothetical protein